MHVQLSVEKIPPHVINGVSLPHQLKKEASVIISRINVLAVSYVHQVANARLRHRLVMQMENSVAKVRKTILSARQATPVAAFQQTVRIQEFVTVLARSHREAYAINQKRKRILHLPHHLHLLANNGATVCASRLVRHLVVSLPIQQALSKASLMS